jgi:N4-gp56 family major capsid protein
MARAEFNINTLSDLDQARYSVAAILGFQQANVWEPAVSREYDHELIRTRSQTYTKPGGFSIPTSATTPGGDFSYTTPSETQVTNTWSTYEAAVRVDQASQQGSVIELIDMSLTKWVRVANEMVQYLAATAAAAGTTSGQYHYVGQTARASITSSDTITLADLRKAHAKLSKNGAPKFIIPGAPGPVYLGFIPPDVAHDLKAESSGVFEGAINVNASNYQLNALGVAAGTLWFETPSGNATTSATLNADAGDGNVDVYYTIIVADQSFGRVSSPVLQNDYAKDIRLTPNGSIIGRVTQPGTNLGTVKEAGIIANIGFKIIEELGVYRIESASSLGANT